MQYTSPTEISDLIKETCEKANAANLFEKITWSYNKRLTGVLGRAWSRNHIEFSTKIFDLIEPEERRDTIIHETCHLIAWFLYGYEISAHGKEWKRLMVKTDGRPLRCAAKPIPGLDKLRRKIRRYAFECACKGWMLTPKFFACYTKGQKIGCPRCRTELTLTSMVPIIK